MKKYSVPRRLTQSTLLEEAKLPHLVKLTAGLIALFTILFIVWASLTSIEEVASATGKVIPSSYIQAVQHLEGGIVSSIMVKDGELVEKDDVLIHMDSTDAFANLGQIEERKKFLENQARRLEEFLDYRDSNKEELSTLPAQHQAVLESMLESRKSQQRVLKDQIEQKAKELERLAAARLALEKNNAIVEKENNILQELAKKGYGSKLAALSSEKELNQIRGQLEETEQQEKAAESALSETKSRLSSLNADLKKQTLERLNEVTSELVEINSSFDKYKNIADRTSVRSPVRGLVKGLNVNTIGAVVEPGKVLMEIVPVENELIVEIYISPNDIGHVVSGQEVTTKITAFDFSRYGVVKGELESVSASTFENNEGGTFYKALVRLEKPFLGSNPDKNLILPGMTVQADIIVGKKTLLEYLLKPIYIAKEGAFREQ